MFAFRDRIPQADAEGNRRTVRVEPITLNLRRPFRIAHGTSTARHNVLVHLDDGVGEGAPVPYYGYSQAEAVAYLQGLDPDALLGGDTLALEDALDRLPPGPGPARGGD